MKINKLQSIIIAGAVCFGYNVNAQDVQSAAAAAAQELSKAAEVEKVEAKPNPWVSSVQFDLGFNQTSLNDWAAGGYNTLTLNTGLDANAKYTKDLMSWANRLQLQYGFLWSADKDNLIQKSTDRIYLESKWAYKTGAKSKWNYTASYDFRSQFSNTYSDYKQLEDKSWTGTLKSGLVSPAYTNIALGIGWNPNNWFSMEFSPVTGGFTIVSIEELRKSYGMLLREDGLPTDVGSNYRSAKFQFGAQFKADAKFVINEVFNYQTQVVLFTDYLDNPFREVRVNWDNKVTWNVAKYFKIDFNTWLIYDPNVLIKNNKDLDAYPEGTQRIQFKEFISFNFTYTFKPRRLRQ